MRQWASVAVSAIALASLAVACSTGGDDAVGTLAPLPTLAPTATLTATATAAAAATPPDGALACDQRAAANASLATAVEQALTGYKGTWGFALYDMECDTMVTVNPDYLQYPASASKIITVIATLRAVQEGRVDLAEVEPVMDEVLTWSSDYHADLLETYLTPEDLSAVLTDAGTSEAAYIRGTWHYTYMTPSDMARVWAALVQGRLLNDELTALLLEKTSKAEIPPEYGTWPSPVATEIPGFGYGQKAGYWVSDGVPYHFVGAGYLRDTVDPGRSFIPVVFLRAEDPNLMEPQRRSVWPLVVEHIATVRDLPELMPLAVAP